MIIPKTPVDKKKYCKNASFASSARECWEAILEHEQVEIGSDKLSVLLPAYIGRTDREGSGIFDPVLSRDVKYSFYKIDHKLNIDWEEFESDLESSGCQLLLIVHYFGFYFSKTREMIELCRKKNIVVVEDCAHLFNFNQVISPAGKYSDYCFYSIHKNLPVSRGGILQVNSGKVINLKDDPDAENEFVKVIAISEYSKIIQKKRSNFSLLFSKLNEMKGLKPLRSLSENDVPHDFPVLVEDGLREKLYFYLIDQGIPVISLYYRLTEEIEEMHFPESYQVSNAILNFPVHQDVSEDHLLFLVNCLEDFFGSKI